METTRIIFDTPLPPWLVATIGLLIVAAALAFALRDTRTINVWARRGIIGMMLLAGLMAVAMALGPTIIRRSPDPHPAEIALLLDGSLSMQLADTYKDDEAAWILSRQEAMEDNGADSDQPPGEPAAGESGEPARAEPGKPRPSRQALVNMVLAEGRDSWLAALAKQFEISAYRFSADVERVTLEGDAAYNLDDEGYSTDLAAALSRIGGGTGGRHPRAIIVIGDGAWNKDDPTTVARSLGMRETPVFTLGVGDPNPPKDAAVNSLRADEAVLLGDEVTLAAQVTTTGLAATTVTVELLVGSTVLESKQIVSLPTGQPTTVHFRHVPERPGRQRYKVRIPLLEGEENADNNSVSTLVEVSERKIRILLLDAEPRWEFRFLRNAFERDPSVQLTVGLTRPGIGPLSGPGYCDKLPTGKDEFMKYDLVILGDIDASTMPAEFLSELAEAVQQGGSALIVIAGKRGHYNGLVGTPLAPILPVRLEPAVLLTRERGQLYGLELSQEGQKHLMMRLASQEDQNAAAWRALPESEWSATVGELMPGATAMIVHPHRTAGGSKMPILAVHRVGQGKVMFMGIEDTWRWRRTVGDKYHYRFWAQAVRWMVKKQFSGDGDPRARLSVDRLRCDVGEQIQIDALCLADDGFPLREAKVWAEVTDSRNTKQRLVMTPGAYGMWQTNYVPKQPGRIRIRPIVSIHGDDPLPTEVEVAVERVNLEKNFLAQNKKSLEDIAAASGGKYLSFIQAHQLAELLSGRAETRINIHPYSPCRHWTFYTVLALLLGGAWLTRKRSGLA